MKRKIAVSQLTVGMYIEEMGGSWIQHPFLRSRFVINDPIDIRLIEESGIEEVWIDPSRGKDVAPEPSAPAPAHAAETRTPPRAASVKPASMADEVTRARRICAQGRQAVVSMFQEVRMGNAVSAEAAGSLVDEISASVLRNPGALISLARLKTADNYTYMHSVAVCAMMVSLARALNFEEAQTRDAGMAGLLHDLGKAVIPIDILNKPGKLTADEFTVVRSHPERGHALLVEGGNASDMVREVCLHHHEKLDGSGYPHRLAGEGLSLFARMGAVCDVYDAITSNRPYKAGWDPAESIRRMTGWCGGHFDEAVFRAFVKSIGIYPIGSMVRLTSGRLAVVIEQSPQSLLTPVVKAFFSTKSVVHIPPESIDQARPSCREKIVSAESPEKWGIKNLEQFWAE